MITHKQKNVGGLLVAIKNRPAGEMEKNGKVITWESRKQLHILPFESDREIRKYSIAPSKEDFIIQQLEMVHWGALIELELGQKNEVIDITVVSDVLKDFYESEMEV